MSTRKKQPLGELSNSQTPSRYAPSTPHAIRALQQRSGAARSRSAYVRRTRGYSDTIVNPESARGILRRLAKLTAQKVEKNETIRRFDDDKENHDTPDQEDGVLSKRPRLTLDVEDSLDEDDNTSGLLPLWRGEEDEDEDSEILVVPTPSILPDDDPDAPTLTFKSIDFGGPHSDSIVARRKSSRPSFPPSSPGGDMDDDVDNAEDPTILSEMGRRAISEEPTGRLSRYSFGSIRMSDFGSELEFRRDSDLEQHLKEKPQVELEGYNHGDQNDEPMLFPDETEDLRHLAQSPTLLLHDDSTVNIPPMDESFQLENPVDEMTSANLKAGNVLPEPRPSSPPAPQDIPASVADESTRSELHQEPDEAIVAKPTVSSTKASVPRRRKVKMTQNGQVIPSLPASLIKRVAIQAQDRLGNRRPKLGRDHVKALEQATDWFFEQVGQDLEAYSDHGRRKRRVDASDMLMLMRRQRVLGGSGELGQAAKELLPKEVVADLELPETL
ncbi:hypothetical protein PV10_05216 [Exophiala mesophila]|uniref:CENP-T/Histone H4 histone fold domain-containing protein n=1 Tax=Exophiala mesophila TaxID=212818 RepID=A0A0D1ZJG8_EXOME|nr:uncharacterized protein PV10_05216 [Exophiala mesophila]KIV94059.1 hypothetical protein PV10_05216 [Exophiala mesophila]